MPKTRQPEEAEAENFPTFLQIVDSLQIFLEERHGLFQYPTEKIIRQSSRDAVFYEIDETEGSAAGRKGVVGCITIRLYLYHHNTDSIARRDLELHSTNSFPSSDQDNQYTYDIDMNALDAALIPLIGRPDDSDELR